MKKIKQYIKSITEIINNNEPCPININNIGIDLSSIDCIEWFESDGKLSLLQIHFRQILELKDKIKVHIKEPNTPEYIVLWDKFDEDECVDYVKKNVNKVIYKIYNDLYRNSVSSTRVIKIIFTDNTVVLFSLK